MNRNGSLAALSDTYRSTAAHMFTKARIILDNWSWPAANPRIRDVWLFGTGRTEPLLVFPVTPAAVRTRTFSRRS